MTETSLTYGALLLGSFIAIGLSGFVTVQTYLYYKIYPKDQSRIKTLVAVVWTLDFIHTTLVCSSVYHYLILHFGDYRELPIIPTTMSLSIATTAVLTFLVHCFFAHRIWMFSKHNWYITGPILVIALLRLCCASVTTGALIHYRTFPDFKKHFRWVFTTGLALSSGVDVVITGSLLYFLRSSRTESRRLNRVIDSLILYTFETGSLTCFATIISMFFWLFMSHNLIFMGMHFAIGKLYANSLLVTLNTRNAIRRGRVAPTTQGDTGLPVTFLTGGGDSNQPRKPSSAFSHFRHPSDYSREPNVVQISVQKTIQEEIGSETTYDKEESQYMGI